MARPRVVLIETTGPHAGPGCAEFLADGAELAADGTDVRVLLLGNGVSAALPGAVPQVASLVAAGARVGVDDFSIRRRGMSTVTLETGVDRDALEALAPDVANAEVRVVWH